VYTVLLLLRQHTQKAFLAVLELEVLVWEFGAINALAACAVTIGEVATLYHKVLDNSVEGGTFVALALEADSKRAKVLGGLQGIGGQSGAMQQTTSAKRTLGTVLPYKPITILPMSSSPCWMSK
jgi:hypothetical protein